MYNLKTLENGLTLITVDMPHLDSVTSLVAVGAGSRYEDKKISGVSHFLEHMFFKGSKKFPSAEKIATMVDGIGAANNAATDKEVTYYWIKSASKHLELSIDILSSMIKESLLDQNEIEREKGVIIEELRMYRDNPQRLVWEKFEDLMYGDTPLGRDIGGDEGTVTGMKRDDFVKYMDSLYSPANMALVFAGKIPANIDDLVSKYFADLPKRGKFAYPKHEDVEQKQARVGIVNRKIDQANVILGVKSCNRYDPKRHATRVLAAILGEGMSSRLFMQVREKRGLAYHISAYHVPYYDAGFFAVFAGIKLEKIEEGIKVIKSELEKTTKELVSADELKKAKEMIRGRIALKSESTNFLAEYFGTEFVMDRKIESFDEYLVEIDKVSLEDILEIAKEIFVNHNYNLELVGPFEEKEKFLAILNE